MKKSIKLWQLLGFLTTSVAGTLLHFLYEWSEESFWIAPFSGVNESTWEHMKLLFLPMFLFAIIQSFFIKNREDFFCIKLRGIILGLLLIPTIFYTYNGAIGKSPDWFNIAIFFIVAAVVYIYEARLFISEKIFRCSQKMSLIILCIIALLFIIFTYITPELNIFKDPINGTYGIQ